MEQDQILLRESLSNVNKTTEFQFSHFHIHLQLVMYAEQLVPNLPFVNKLDECMKNVSK